MVDPVVPASFPGGEEAMWKFLSERVEYPTSVEAEGTVYVEFDIAVDGAISNARIIKGVNGSLDREAKRVVSAFPNWIPATLDGKPMPSSWIVPIAFRL